MTRQRLGRTAAALVALALGGCATTYQVTLMPRNSGKLYTGVLENANTGEGAISVTIEGVTYRGTWVETTPSRTTGYVTGAVGSRRAWAWGGGSILSVDNPEGGTAKALLQSPDGKGLRCDLRESGRTGGGTCRDDAGNEYDVQLRQSARQ